VVSPTKNAALGNTYSDKQILAHGDIVERTGCPLESEQVSLTRGGYRIFKVLKEWRPLPMRQGMMSEAKLY